jgi:rifampin ADP-ribosylating transferase
MTFYHGTTAGLRPGELISPGHAAHEFTGEPEGLVWFADELEFAEFWGEAGAEDGEAVHLYEVTPTGDFDDDRGVATGQVVPGNFQSRYPLRVVREV